MHLIAVQTVEIIPVTTDNETGVEGFGNEMEEIQWEDDEFLCHTSQHFVAAEARYES